MLLAQWVHCLLGPDQPCLANLIHQSLVSPPTDMVYAQLCERHGLAPNSEILEDGTQAHWIGPSSAEKIIINFHGIITPS
jgi:hypothetical protein